MPRTTRFFPHAQFLLSRIQQNQWAHSVLLKETQPLLPSSNEWNPRQTVPLQCTDLCAWKPGSQLTVAGNAASPHSRPVRELQVEIAIAKRNHSLQIFGQRHIQAHGTGFALGPPIPFRSMPLSLGLAFGGESLGWAFPPNPIGQGFHAYCRHTDVVGEPLPCLEDPNHLLEPQWINTVEPWAWRTLPRPAHCGYLPSVFFPRNRWRKQRPSDPRWHFSSTPKLCFPEGLVPGQVLSLRHCHPEHSLLQTQLPRNAPWAWIRGNGETRSSLMEIQDVHVDLRIRVLFIVWRAIFPIGDASLCDGGQEFSCGTEWAEHG
ncbi:MAG TPA: DUF2169 domain-containing protein [Fibrobacteraceae bacterium]|nr:DUF2169 domain-containing protein [Fibrobacteraceae bacterium]